MPDTNEMREARQALLRANMIEREQNAAEAFMKIQLKHEKDQEVLQVQEIVNDGSN